MPQADPVTIMVLGPMRLQRGRSAPEPRTRDLQALVDDIAARIKARPNYAGPDVLPVIAPDDNTSTNIIPGILERIERADLVIVDLTRDRPNVMYEVGLIHALGLPHIFVTAGREPVFYFKTDHHIARFDLARAYDPNRKGHTELLDRLLAFLTNPAERERFASNQVSAFFDNLPIIDISAAAGLAAGYWVNAIDRFVRPGGYFEAPAHDVTWQAQAGFDAGSTRIGIGHFLAISPPGRLLRAPADDTAELAASLSALGLGLVFATVANRPEDPGAMRPYSAQFLARVVEGRIELVSPGIVLEIPSTLYALRFARRILRIDRGIEYGMSSDLLDDIKRRRFADMLRRFGNLMQAFLRDPRYSRRTEQFRFVELDALPQTLRAIGAIPG